MKQRLVELEEKINTLSLRERALVFLMAAAVVVMFFQFLLIDSLVASNRVSSSEVSRIKLDIQKKQSELAVINAQLTVGVNKGRESKRKALKAKLSQLNDRIEESVVAMIPPRLMAQVLENILMQDDKLKLISLENKPVETLARQSDMEGSGSGGENISSVKTAVNQGLYKHVFVLTLEGGYSAAIDYFEKLAALPWRFYWDDLHYEVVSYPKAIITLEVHTVSMSEDWIGV